MKSEREGRSKINTIIPAKFLSSRNNDEKDEENEGLVAVPLTKKTKNGYSVQEQNEQLVEKEAVVVEMKQTKASGVFRLILLIVLVFQITSFVLLNRYSSGTLKEKYNVGSIVLGAEMLKLVISIVCILFNKDKQGQRFNFSYERIIFMFSDSASFILLAFLYSLQQILTLLALACIDGTTFSLLMQGKIMTTAIFSLIVMKRTLVPRQWRALALLFFGVLQITHETKPPSSSSNDVSWIFINGILLSMLNLTLNGFSTVFMESVMKGGQAKNRLDIWEQNFVLATFSIIITFVIVLYQTGIDIFHDWTPLAFLITLISGGGGILVAFCLKYADSIEKQMASTFSIVLITLIEWSFLNGPMNFLIMIGIIMVILAVYNYNEK